LEKKNCNYVVNGILEFNKWLHNEETSNYVQYVHLTATKRKSTGAETYYYECSRTGKRSHVDENVRKRKARKWVAKLNRGCTSQIIVNKSHDGSYSINYFKTHYGHEIGLEHVKLSKQDRGSVASKLLLGLPISTVLHSVKNANGNLKRINLLARKDVFNIRKSFNIDLRDGKLANIDAVNVNSFLAECNTHRNNPVLYSNVEDFPKSDEICFIIMSRYQSEVLKEAGNNIVVINTTPLKNCDFELITLFVISKSWEIFPAACMFTNKVHYGMYDLFFNKIRARVGTVVPTVVVTNCDEMYYQAWRSAMGDVTFNIYNPIQIDVDWKSNLNRIICAETDVTRVKRKWVYETMKILQNNHDEADFMENLEATMKVLNSDQDFNDFLQFFLKNYSDPKKWADCYKNGVDLPSKQLEVISDLLRQYLNEENETRFDKIFHSLIRFIRDETVNSMLKSKANRVFFMNENDSRHNSMIDKHFNGTNIGENLWNVVEEECATTHVVQKYLERKCCNLICTLCHICLHCFSCTCVDFFVENSICVHIHYVWVTYFQSIMQSDCDNDREPSCDEEIIIEVDQEHDDEIIDDIDILRNTIGDRTSVLTSNIYNVQNKSTLKVILDTVNQLCDLSAVGGHFDTSQPEDGDRDILGDHSYL
jgi:predicted regulator of amino acid metabolism with ACT domain